MVSHERERSQRRRIHSIQRNVPWRGLTPEALTRAAERLLQRLPGSGPSKWPFCLHAAGLEAGLPVAWVGGSARLLQARLLLEQGRSGEARTVAAPVLKANRRAHLAASCWTAR